MKKLMSLNGVLVLLLLIPVVVLGTFLRGYRLDTTGLEVDEVSNFEVAQSYYQYDYPSVKPEVDGSRLLYYFHPVFGYMMMAEWFNLTGDVSILGTRTLNAVESVIALVLIFTFLLRKGVGTALLATFFVAVDSWMVLINRMNYLENFQVILMLLGMWLFYKAVQGGDEGKLHLWIIAGVLLGLTVVYKHIGVYLVAVVMANWLILRKYFKGHLVTMTTIGVVVVSYVVVMYLIGGQYYIDQQMTMFGRLFGTIESRGLNFGIGDALGVIVNRYWIFATTILVLIGGWGWAMWNYVWGVFRKITVKDSVILSWTVGALVFAVASKLKSPHYLILWLVPTYIYVATELAGWAKGKKLVYTSALISFFLLANVFTWHYRFVMQTGDTLRDVSSYINANVPNDAVVATESYVGALIKQPYLRIDHLSNPAVLGRVDYLAIYLSTTATIQGLPDVVQEYQFYCDPVSEFAGFKDRIVLCRVNHQGVIDHYALASFSQ